MEEEASATGGSRLGEILESLRAENAAMDTESNADEDNDGRGEGEKASEEEDDEDDDTDGGCALRFENGVTPLDLMEDDAPELELHEQLEHLDSEHLAKKKRKAPSDDHGEGSLKRTRKEDFSGASYDEIKEAMGYYSVERKSREFKRRGRRSGSKSKLSLEVTRMLGEANLYYARGLYNKAIHILKEVVRKAAKLPEPYHTLGIIYSAKGDQKKALNFYLLAAYFGLKKSSLWRQLIIMSIEQGKTGLARYCLSSAIRADPTDTVLISLCASLYVELGDYQKAAESYLQISRLCPENVEALKMGCKLYVKCDLVECSISTLEDYLKDHPSDFDFAVVDLLAAICMENNAHDKALQHIENARLVNGSIKEWPCSLTTKEGICQIHLGNLEKAEFLFSVFQWPTAYAHVDLINQVADSYKTHGLHESALKYYLMLEGINDSGYVQLKIAQCHLSLKERIKAIPFFYKALHKLDNNIDARLTLASILLQEARDDDAIALLLPPKESTADSSPEISKPWWLDGEVKLKLSKIYWAKGKLEDFVDSIYLLVRDSLDIETHRQKVKKRLSMNTLMERAKLFDDLEKDYVFHVRPLVSSADWERAVRAKKVIEKRKEKQAAALAAGLNWQSDDSDEGLPQQLGEAPLSNLLKDKEYHHIIIDLSEALVTLQKFDEAFQIINKALKLSDNSELEYLAARIACKMKPDQGFILLKRILKLHPYSLTAWNSMYKILSSSSFGCSQRPDYHYQKKHWDFLHKTRIKYKGWAPPIIISGHRYTMISQHQGAAREYLEAYKLMPESPLINLCVGTALINLALGFRIQNKHQCLTQGIAFLYNNLRLCKSSQESLFNIARAYQHVGLVSLAASYYEKVLAMHEKDYCIPKLPHEDQTGEECPKPGYCDLRREAAYNLHLIYKRSGAFDLARQVLKDHCTL